MTGDAATASPYRLLVVEDENVVAMDLRASLIRLGYRVTDTVGTGRDAIERVTRQLPDLVLMDVRLRGDMDGIHAAEHIQRLDIPVVYLTAFSDRSTLARARDTQPFGYVLKPFDERDLQVTIEMAIHRHRAQKEHDQLLRERIERASLEEEHRWTRFLSDASGELSSSLDVGKTLEMVARVAVPTLADWGVVHARSGEGFETLAIHHRTGREDLVRELLRRDLATLPREVEFSRVIRTGRPESSADRICVPLMARGKTWGALTTGAEPGRRYGRQDLAHAIDLAERCSMAVDNAQLYERARRANDQSEALIQDLKRTVRFSEMFVGMLGHDLRNPLSAIATAASLITRRTDAATITRPAARILASASRMGRMIDQLLDFTRIRLGEGIPLERRTVNLRKICELVGAEFDRGDATAVHIVATGDVLGNWDADRLSQLLSNLVGNALLHGAGGTTVVIDGTDPRSVTLEVRNPGAIPSAVLPLIFEPFRSGTDKKQERSSGLGLGLHISQQIVTAHGGSIAVASSEADGTTFTVSLPRGEPGPAPEPTA
jgi:signal transduction histidine kinase/CheY-like chemotaxis protein